MVQRLELSGVDGAFQGDDRAGRLTGRLDVVGQGGADAGDAVSLTQCPAVEEANAGQVGQAETFKIVVEVGGVGQAQPVGQGGGENDMRAVGTAE